MFYRKESAVADKNTREANLANATNEAEYHLAQALDAPAGPGRIERLVKAYDAADAAAQAYDDCISGRAYTVPRTR